MFRSALLLMLFAIPLTAQESRALPERQPEGGGPVEYEPVACLQPEQYPLIQALLQDQREKLQAQGKLQLKDEAARPAFTSPLALNGQVNGYQPWAISNYVDQNTGFPSKVLDYNGGQRTYDLESGYNHRGIDYPLWPYNWDMMAKREVAVVAAAPGTILYKNDGLSDMHYALLNGSV